MGKSKKEKKGVFTSEAGESAFAFPIVIHESGDKLEQLLTVPGFGDEAILGATHTYSCTRCER
jgi:hypothetical protein